MNTSTYKPADLAKKYSNFLSPAIEISVDGNKISDNFLIKGTEIDLTIDNQHVSTATIRLADKSSLTKSVDEYSTLSAFPLMKKVKIKMGYGDKLTQTFVGHIFERVLSIDDEPFLTIYCMDNKNIMRFGSDYEIHKDIKKYSALVSKVLEKYKYQTEVVATDDFKESATLAQYGISDFDYVCLIAEETGYEFFSSEEKIYFRKPMPDKSEIVTLEPLYIRSISYKTSMWGMFTELKVNGYNQDTKQDVKGEATKVTTKIGSGNTAMDILSGGGVKVTQTASIQMNNRINKDLNKVAAVHMQRQSENLVEMVVTTPGMPEIIPGRFMKIDGMGSDINNTYYIKRVNHDLKKSGFITHMTCCSNTVPK